MCALKEYLSISHDILGVSEVILATAVRCLICGLTSIDPLPISLVQGNRIHKQQFKKSNNV